jgi:hypothetical protein
LGIFGWVHQKQVDGFVAVNEEDKKKVENEFQDYYNGVKIIRRE